MEKATLNKRGKGWLLVFENNKEMTITWNNIPDAWNNCQVEVEREKGQPVKLKNGEVVLAKPAAPVMQNNYPQQRGSFNRDNRSNYEVSTETAFAPYNFVPLNEKVIYPAVQTVNLGRYSGCSGYIDVQIENMTHLMISSGKNEDNKIHDFLKIGKGNKPIIPGSSLRGLIKNTIEVLSYSRLFPGENFDNKALYYRSVFGRDSLTKSYLDKMITKDGAGNVTSKIKAGYIYKVKNEYKIQPAKIDPVSEFQYHRVYAKPELINNEFDHFKINGKKYKKYDFEDVYFVSKPVTIKEKGPLKLAYPVVDDIKFASANGHNKGKLIITGAIGKAKHYQWIVNEIDTAAVAINVPKAVIDNYESDEERSEDYDLLGKIKGDGKVPCFYLLDSSKTGSPVCEIGHTGFFRIKHRNEIQDAVNYDEYDDDKFDYAEMMFGVLDAFSTRLFFEDAVFNGDPAGKQTDNYNNTGKPPLLKILASPKPTSHQLYIDQGKDAGIADKNWSTDGIRVSGYKEYWHKIGPVNTWAESENTAITDSHTGYLKAIIPNQRFDGRIRFENLTKEELGALLMALDLTGNCCHKIGMGKPYGLGSIKIKTTLNIIDRNKRYSSLINTDGKWNLAITTLPEDGKLIYKNSFAHHILESLSNNTPDNQASEKLWSVERLQHFRTMLEFDANKQSSPEWLEATRYMQIEHPDNKNEYKNRAVLPKPLAVKRKLK